MADKHHRFTVSSLVYSLPPTNRLKETMLWFLTVYDHISGVTQLLLNLLLERAQTAYKSHGEVQPHSDHGSGGGL